MTDNVVNIYVDYAKTLRTAKQDRIKANKATNNHKQKAQNRQTYETAVAQAIKTRDAALSKNFEDSPQTSVNVIRGDCHKCGIMVGALPTGQVTEFFEVKSEISRFETGTVFCAKCRNPAIEHKHHAGDDF